MSADDLYPLSARILIQIREGVPNAISEPFEVRAASTVEHEPNEDGATKTHEVDCYDVIGGLASAMRDQIAFVRQQGDPEATEEREDYFRKLAAWIVAPHQDEEAA